MADAKSSTTNGPRPRPKSFFNPQSSPLRRRKPRKLPSSTLLLFLAAASIFSLELTYLAVLRNHAPPPPPCANASTAAWGADMGPLPVRAAAGEFWRQPDGGGYRPCIEFGIGYRKDSARVAREKKRFLMVIVTGGLNQQRNEIVDAVVIARILEAALVLPVLQVNQIWGDERYEGQILNLHHHNLHSSKLQTV